MKYEFQSSLFDENRDGIISPYHLELSGAIHLAMQKWHPDNPQRGQGSCALCAIFNNHGACEGCPFGNCSHGSFYEAYLDAEDSRTQEYAMDLMYNKLVELYELELAREATP